MQVLLNFENDLQTQIKQTTLAIFWQSRNRKSTLIQQTSAYCSNSWPNRSCGRFPTNDYCQCHTRTTRFQCCPAASIRRTCPSNKPATIRFRFLSDPPQQIIQNQIGTDTTTQTVLPVVTTTTTTAVPIVQDECFARSCDQTIMGRQLIYARALEIVTEWRVS